LSDANYVSVKINSHPVKVLIDSGATRSCISRKFLSRLHLTPSPLAPDVSTDLFTANNASMRILGQVELSIYLNGLIVPFTFLVLPTLFHDCIVATDFMLASHAKIDFRDRRISFYDDLIVVPLTHLHSHFDVVRLAQALSIPPRCEALASVVLPKRYKPQLSIVEPLPSLQRRNIGLARVLILPSRSVSVCRFLNPTQATVTLLANLAVGTIEPVDANDSHNRKMLSRHRFYPPHVINSLSTSRLHRRLT